MTSSIPAEIFWPMVVFVFGTIVGSFLNVCIYRMPREKSIVFPGSHCTKCNAALRWYHNIPLLSWMVLRGRCAFCGAAISAIYPLVEFFNAALWVLLWLKFGLSVQFFFYALVVSAFLVGMFIDFEHYILPDEITLGGTLVGLVASILFPQLQLVAVQPIQYAENWVQGAWQALVGFAVGGGVLAVVRWFGGLIFGRKLYEFEKDVTLSLANGRLRLDDGEEPEEEELKEVLSSRRDRIVFQAIDGCIGDEKIAGKTVQITVRELMIGERHWPVADLPRFEATARQIEMPREAMGMGDVKLMMAIGTCLGWWSTLFSLVLSSALGSIIGLLLIVVFRARQWGAHIPYGPYIVIGSFLWIFFGPEFVQWYFSQPLPH